MNFTMMWLDGPGVRWMGGWVDYSYPPFK
jgi:hypothetical protein